ELDALRGLMLVWITLTHLPTNLSKYVNQPFGYVGATEGFIFLSALFTGLIDCRVSEREGPIAMWRRLWKRAGRPGFDGRPGFHGVWLQMAYRRDHRRRAGRQEGD